VQQTSVVSSVENHGDDRRGRGQHGGFDLRLRRVQSAIITVLVSMSAIIQVICTVAAVVDVWV
jgi:hypothetical protein